MIEFLILSVLLMLWHINVNLKLVNEHLSRLREKSKHFKLKDIRESRQ